MIGSQQINVAVNPETIDVNVDDITINVIAKTISTTTLRKRVNLAGSLGSGSDGDDDRVFTLTISGVVDIVEVYLDGLLLIEITQYTIDNTAKTVTMVNQVVFDTQTLSAFYNV